MTCDEGRPCQRWSVPTIFFALEVDTYLKFLSACQHQERNRPPLPRRTETLRRCEGEGTIDI